MRSRLAEALRSTIETHLSMVNSIEEASHQDEEAKVTYLARTPAARDAARAAADSDDTSERSSR
jgi:hypothetical protein